MTASILRVLEQRRTTATIKKKKLFSICPVGQKKTNWFTEPSESGSASFGDQTMNIGTEKCAELARSGRVGL